VSAFVFYGVFGFTEEWLIHSGNKSCGIRGNRERDMNMEFFAFPK
jgi:hypothetical protein